MIDSNLIEALARVVECGGFEKAAKALFISQSAVSQRIKQLEEYMGQVLIARTAPPRPTAAGRKLLKYYKQIKYLEEEVLAKLVAGVEEKYTVLTLGVNADSLATWFFDVVNIFFEKHHALMHLIVDDQEETHKLLRNGDVVGCISASNTIVQGCSCHYLGSMKYKLAASPKFSKYWFKTGVNYASALTAPAVLFNTKDTLHHQLFKKVFNKFPSELNTHYVPSPEQLLQTVIYGLGYGVVPDIQAGKYFNTGELIDLFPGQDISVKLFWHCWNIDLKFLKQFTKLLVDSSRNILDT